MSGVVVINQVPVTLLDENGNCIGVIVDAADGYRLQVEASVTGQNTNDDGVVFITAEVNNDKQLRIVDDHANITLHRIVEVLEKIDNRLSQLESET